MSMQAVGSACMRRRCWQSPVAAAAAAAATRPFATSRLVQHNPLGLPRPPPQMPRRTGAVQKRPIPNVTKVLAVASGKGGVGKSTVAVNLAFALGMRQLRVGVLDLDIFGPSIPTLLGLNDAPEPQLSEGGAIYPLVSHGMPCMSMGFLAPEGPVVWRGLMVQKAVQQLLFDVDWSSGAGRGAGLDVLVIDMPPGTGDVPLTLGQLVNVDGAVIVSTPQDVALADVRKGITTFQKLNVPITGLVLNEAYFKCTNCAMPHHLFGPPTAFRATADKMGIRILGELPLVGGVSAEGDRGTPYVLSQSDSEWATHMKDIAADVWQSLQS